MEQVMDQDKPTLTISEGPRAASWVLEVRDDGGARYLPITGERLVVGSAPSADIVVRDATVSSRHCSLFMDDNGLWITDLASKNGTYIGGARIKEAWCNLGASISIGRSLLLLGEGAAAKDDKPIRGHGGGDDLRPLPGVVGSSMAMRRTAAFVRRLANYVHPVLIAGETGTGKELIARALHTEGPRNDRPFVVLNVAAIPRELVESELFGHERGAFTGATTRRPGAFADAEGGTLFLDEIGELPLEAQPKLLRALDGYEIRRVGAVGSGVRSNVRVVAASHVALEARVEEGLFRRDLFHRLEAFVVRVPPLRERKSDVAAIAQSILASSCAEIGPRTLAPGGLGRLESHDWPGNVRELRNVLIRAADLTSHQGVIDAVHIERAMRPQSTARPPLTLTPQSARALFAQHGNNLSAAARAAGYARTSFRKLLGREDDKGKAGGGKME
ncbi:sigma 54-interacting transcriptional regulator [Pendulispora albinea]|uniref:Sigma 54-interacting transcriptional regulator n=1 Tax=Pendulispora albinea TaxID=2741071 RepID=A0ABZ2M8B6_9BACT